MSIEKKIEVCIGTDRAKCVRVRLSLMIVDNGKVVSEHYHSMNIEPGANADLIRADVEEHIGSENSGIPFAPWPKIPDAEWQRAVAHIEVEHTTDAVLAYRRARSVPTAEPTEKT